MTLAQAKHYTVYYKQEILGRRLRHAKPTHYTCCICP